MIPPTHKGKYISSIISYLIVELVNSYALLLCLEFIGHFHVALIHLPIGILLIALLLLLLRKNQKYNISYPGYKNYFIDWCFICVAFMYYRICFINNR